MSLAECTFCCWWRKPKSKLQTRTSEHCQSKWGLACERHTDSLRKWIIWFLMGVWSSLAWRRWQKKTGKGGVINVAISATSALLPFPILCSLTVWYPHSLHPSLFAADFSQLLLSTPLLPACLSLWPGFLLCSMSMALTPPAVPPFLLCTPLACLKSLWPVHSLFY